MEKVGSEIALRQVPTRPNFVAGSYLHANLAWHLGTVFRVPGMCVFEARSLIVFHPLGKKHQVSCSLCHSRSLFECSGEEFLRVITRMILFCQGEGAPELCRCVVSAIATSQSSTC